MLFIGFGKKVHKGKLTDQKAKRMLGLRTLARIRVSEINLAFEKRPYAKKLIEVLEQKKLEADSLFKTKPRSPEQKATSVSAVKDYLKTHTDYLEALKKFANDNKKRFGEPSHAWLNSINRRISKNQEGLAKLEKHD